MTSASAFELLLICGVLGIGALLAIVAAIVLVSDTLTHDHPGGRP